MAPFSIPAIDVHGHYGAYRRDGVGGLAEQFMSADGPAVAERGRRANIQATAVSPLSGLLPRGRAEVVPANEEAAQVVAATPGLLQWVIVHPLQPESYRQAADMLQHPRCVGIKIHPEEHCYPIREHGAALFEFASRHNAVVLAHTGDPDSLPHDFVPFADAHPNVRLILAHLGNGGAAGGDPILQVRAIQAARRGNLFVDTSSARSVLPRLVEWAVPEIGADRILFGTDTPLYFSAMQRARIEYAEIDDDDKFKILRGNAERLFGRETLERA